MLTTWGRIGHQDVSMMLVGLPTKDSFRHLLAVACKEVVDSDQILMQSVNLILDLFLFSLMLTDFR